MADQGHDDLPAVLLRYVVGRNGEGMGDLGVPQGWDRRRHVLQGLKGLIGWACLHDKPDVTPLREEDAYPADPEDG